MVQGSLAIRQFRQDDCLSYIVFDRSSLQAMVVDPRPDLMDAYREFLGQTGCRIAYAIDTRLQADHLSATHLFKMEQGCELLMSSKTTSQRLTRKLGDGEVVTLGKCTFQAFHAPGASQDGLVLRSKDWLLTGDALWIGTLAHAELPGTDVAALWSSVRRLASELPADLLIYPGHDRQGILFSTLEVEKKRNPVFLKASPEALLESLSEYRPTRLDQESVERLGYNQALSLSERGALGVRPGSFGARKYEEDYGASRISVEKFRKKLEERASGFEFLDVRESFEFRAGHIPGMRNVALADLGPEFKKLSTAKRIYVSCLSGLRSAMAARTLAYLGVKDVVVVSGGIQAWNQAGFPVTEKVVD
jgi:glyoxylase-like metal-dependent hydrolase (beta-lactamase superfamily II)/rhodanese-related sulfurtransferase